MKNLRSLPNRSTLFGWLITLLLCLILFLFTLNAQRYMQAFSDGASLWVTCVLPSSLPFLFLTALLTATGSVERLSRLFNPFSRGLFGMSGAGGFCLLTSLLCGYPVGAKTLSDLYESGRIDPQECTPVSLVASSSGPLFILGSVGCGMFASFEIGLILLVSHFLALFISGMGMRFLVKSNKRSETASLVAGKKSDNLLYDGMYSSVISVAVVGGFVAVFYAFSFLLLDYKILAPLVDGLEFLGMPPTYAVGFARGLIEMTGGCGALAANADPLSLALCACLITFGGMSILFQQICYLSKAKVKIPLFLLVKALQAILAGLVCYGICLLIRP